MPIEENGHDRTGQHENGIVGCNGACFQRCTFSAQAQPPYGNPNAGAIVGGVLGIIGSADAATAATAASPTAAAAATAGNFCASSRSRLIVREPPQRRLNARQQAQAQEQARQRQQAAVARSARSSRQPPRPPQMPRPKPTPTRGVAWRRRTSCGPIRCSPPSSAPMARISPC